MAVIDTVVYDFAVDGALNRVALSGMATRKSLIFIRDVAFASADQLGLYLSEDAGVTAEDGAEEYESFSLSVLASTGFSSSNTGFLSSSVLFGAANTQAQDAIIEIEGMGSPGQKTLFNSFASDGFTVQTRQGWRSIARVEDGLILASAGGQNITAGQIISRVYTGNPGVSLAVQSLFGAAI